MRLRGTLDPAPNPEKPKCETKLVYFRPRLNANRKLGRFNQRVLHNVYRILCDTEYLYYCMDYAQTRIEKVAIELRG